LGGVLGDIAGKLLALPVSLVAIIALEQTSSNFAFWIGCLALFVVSIIYLTVLYNQNLQVTRLKGSFDLAFSPFFSKIDTYPKALRDALSQRESGVGRQVKVLSWTFTLFYFIAALPAIGALCQIWSQKVSPSIDWFLKLTKASNQF
jgi:membrane protein implicated in regulation of membrane protease activity